MSDSEYEPPPQLFYENSDIQPQQPQQQRPPAVSLSNSSVLFDAGGTGTDTGTVAGGGHLLYHVPQQQIFSNEEQQRLSSSEYEPPTFDELLEGHGGQKGLGQGEGGDAAVGAGGGGQYAVAANFNTNNPNFTASSASTSFSSSAPPSTMIEMNAVHGNAFGGQQPAAVVQRTENHTNVLQHGGVGRDNGQDDVHEEEDDDLDDEELNSLLMQPRTRAAKNSTNTGSGGAAASKSFVPNRIVNSLRNQLFNRNMASRPGGVSSPYNNSAGIPSRFTNPNTPSSSQAQQTLPSDKQSVVRYIVEQRDLDALLVRVYDYYDGKGLLPILLSKITNLLTIVFIVSFSTFLLWCVDHAEIRKKNRLSDVIVSNCAASIPFFPSMMFLIVFTGWVVYQTVRIFLDYPKLVEMRLVFNKGLEINDSDLSNITWSKVVNQLSKLGLIAAASSSPLSARIFEKLNAHSIANRILRKENYMIAIFNKDLLNLRIPFLFPKSNWGQRSYLTTIMEMNLWLCISSYVFDSNTGCVRKSFLRDSNRAHLANGLRKRFRFMALLNLLLSPFLVLFFLIYFFFRYAEEYHKDPSTIGARHFSRLAMWKFREFNELDHFFHLRLSRCYPAANAYMSQFRKEDVVIIAKFASFIAGSFAAVLALLSLVDQAFVMNFEITPGGSVLFYIGLFGGIYAATRSMIPEDYVILEPERLMKQVIEHTHYCPDKWRGKLHMEEVRDSFSNLFQYKVILFLQEVLSVIFAPSILWYSLPQSSEALVDFFREFSVHVDSLGYVCSFAVFDFKRNGNIKFGAPSEVQNDYYVSKDGKMEKSFLTFKAHNPDWKPDMEGSQMFLNAVLQKRGQTASPIVSPEPKSLEMPDQQSSPPFRGKSTSPQHLYGNNQFQLNAYPNQNILSHSSSASAARSIFMQQQQQQLSNSSLSQSQYNSIGVSSEHEQVGFFGLLDALYEANRNILQH